MSLNPGSEEAIAAGCTCPVYDNARGRGYMGMAGMFVYREGCPVHCAKDQELEELKADPTRMDHERRDGQNWGGPI